MSRQHYNQIGHAENQQYHTAGTRLNAHKPHYDRTPDRMGGTDQIHWCMDSNENRAKKTHSLEDRLDFYVFEQSIDDLTEAALLPEEVNKILCEHTKTYAQKVWEEQKTQFDVCMSMPEAGNEFAEATLSGACLGACIIREDIVHAVNLGDVRAVLITEDQDQYFTCTRLTFDHSTNEDSERERLNTYGIECTHDGYSWRVNGMQPSRVVGDYHRHYRQTDATIFTEPHVASLRIADAIDDPRDAIQNAWVVIASDGVWDEIHEKELENALNHENSHFHKSNMHYKISMETLAYDLYFIASKMGGADDITAVVIKTPDIGSNQTIFAGVYDGHSGSGTAQELCDYFLPHIIQPFGFKISPPPAHCKRLYRLFHEDETTFTEIQQYYKGLNKEDIQAQRLYFNFHVLLFMKKQFAQMKKIHTHTSLTENRYVSQLSRFYNSIFLSLSFFSKSNPILQDDEAYTPENPLTDECYSPTRLNWTAQNLYGRIFTEILRVNTESLGIQKVNDMLPGKNR